MKPWEKYQRAQSDVVAAGAAGGARGALGVLDIVPRGLGGAAYMGRQAASLLPGIPPPGPYRPFTPFANIAGMADIGTRQPTTPAEEKAAFVGEMAGATLPSMGVAGLAGGARAALGEALAGAGATAGGLATEEAGLGRMPGILAGGLAPTAVGAATRRAMLPTGAARAPARIAAAERQGVPISAGQAAGGSWVEKVTESMPGGAQARRRFAEQQTEAMGRRLEDITAGTPEPSRTAAGQAVTQGIDDWANRFRARAQQLYDDVEAVVPPDSLAEPKALRDTLRDLRGSGAFAGITDNPLTSRLAERLDELPSDGVSYRDLKELRSMIGRQLSTPSIIERTPRAELKRIYGAISDDMRDTLELIGGSDAIADWRFADLFWSRGMDRIDDILKPIERRKTPEEVFRAAMSGSREGATRLREIRDTLTQDQWDVVRRTVMRQLGEAMPSGQTFESAAEAAGEFSPERFLTNIGRLSPDARALLFQGADDLDDLTKIASGIREQERYLFNPSGTARLLTNIAAPAAGIGMIYDPSLALGIGGLSAGAYGAQRLMQSPAGVNWMTRPIPPLQMGQIGTVPRLSIGQE